MWVRQSRRGQAEVEGTKADPGPKGSKRFFVFFSAKSSNGLTNEDAQATIATVNECFDKAEEKVFGNKPDNPDTPSGPDPDPEKCICKGTGKIVQGDGHVSDCPYHKKEPAPNKTTCKCDTSKTYCNCIPKYGKCSCTKTSTSNTRTRSILPSFKGL